MQVLDQREIQRKGGLASRYPTAYIIAQFLKRYNFGRVLDVTFGVGRFYKIQRPKLLVGADIKKREWIVVPDIFIQKPVWGLRYEKQLEQLQFDLLVVDPPWGQAQRRTEYSEVVGTPEIIIEYAMKLAKELSIRYVLVHYNKLLKNLDVVENVAFKPWTRYLNSQNTITYFTLYKV